MTLMIGTITYGNETIRYELRYLSTRRTLGIEVYPDQRVVVRAPVGCGDEVIARHVRKRAAWISKQLVHFQRFSPRTPPRRYINGETHLYLGRQYRLKIVQGEPASVKMGRGRLVVAVPGRADPAKVRDLLQVWYRDRAKIIFTDVLEECIKHFKGHTKPRLIVRSMQSRWGSMAASGTMTLNANLIRAPRACIKYVVIHELCHLEHKHHGPAFIKRLERAMPDWATRKQRLEAALL